MRIEPDELVSLERNIVAPVEIALAEGVCTITAIRRLLPGRRLAGQCTYRGRRAFVKLFFGAGARRAHNREKLGGALLRDSGVHTPKLLLDTATAAPGAYALLFEFLATATPISSGIAASGSAKQPLRIASPGEHRGGETPGAAQPHADAGQPDYDTKKAAFAVEALARLHEHGAYHCDSNLNNFLVDAERLYLVDGAAIRHKGSALSEAASLKALAAFLAEFPPKNDYPVPELLARYAGQRGWPEVDRSEHLQAQLTAARRRRVRRYLAKTQRNCTEFHRERGWHWLCLCKRSHWNDRLAAFARNPQAGLADAMVIKNGNSATVFRLKLGSERVVVKRYNLKSTFHRMRRWFKHRARIAWRNGHRLALLGIPTAEPIALIERRWGPLRAECWLVMPDCGLLDIQTEVRERGWSDSLLNDLVRLFQGLQTAGLYHGDTKASNFLIRHGEVRLIDYDGLREHPGSARDIARFLENFDGALKSQAHAKFVATGLIY